MAKVNDPPLALAEIIDHLERMREELLTLQRSLEKIEFVEAAIPNKGHAN
jgi:hypothetical protein